MIMNIILLFDPGALGHLPYHLREAGSIKILVKILVVISLVILLMISVPIFL